MGDLTIEIPSEAVPGLRRALLHTYAGIADALSHAAGEMARTHDVEDLTRGHRVELFDAADALDQVGWELEPLLGGSIELSAHPELLSDALTQMVRDAVQAFDSVVEEAHAGTGPVSSTRTAFEALLVSFHLFEQVHGI